jgi:hypothetical protein
VAGTCPADHEVLQYCGLCHRATTLYNCMILVVVYSGKKSIPAETHCHRGRNRGGTGGYWSYAVTGTLIQSCAPHMYTIGSTGHVPAKDIFIEGIFIQKNFWINNNFNQNLCGWDVSSGSWSSRYNAVAYAIGPQRCICMCWCYSGKKAFTVVTWYWYSNSSLFFFDGYIVEIVLLEVIVVPYYLLERVPSTIYHFFLHTLTLAK